MLVSTKTLPWYPPSPTVCMCLSKNHGHLPASSNFLIVLSLTYLHCDQILGPNMLKWLCPTAVSHIKDGITFPTTRDNSWHSLPLPRSCFSMCDYTKFISHPLSTRVYDLQPGKDSWQHQQFYPENLGRVHSIKSLHHTCRTHARGPITDATLAVTSLESFRCLFRFPFLFLI